MANLADYYQNVYHPGNWGDPNRRTNGWLSGTNDTYLGRGNNDSDSQSQGVANPGVNFGQVNPEDLKLIGFNPQTAYSWSNPQGIGGDSGPVGSGQMMTGFSPELQKYLADNNIQSRVQQGEQGYEHGFFGADGKQIGTGNRWNEPNQDAFGLAMLAAGGFAGSVAAGAGAAGAGLGGATAGASSTDLAALYGPAGYGEGAAGAGEAGLGGAGTYGVELPAAYTGPGSEGFMVAGENAVAPAGWGNVGDIGGSYAGAPTAATNSVLADSALGAPGYGASSAGLGGGAGDLTGIGSATAGGGGIGSTISNGLSSVGDFAKQYPGLTNVAGGIVNGLIGSNATSKAIDAQTQATQNANARLDAQNALARSDWAPYRESGVAAINRNNALLQNPSSVLNDPSFNFVRQQGEQGIQRKAAADGGIYSGATFKALDRYNTGLASSEIDKIFGRNSQMAQLGATGTAGTVASGQTNAGLIGNNLTGLGDANAVGQYINSNVWQNQINNGLANFNRSTYKGS